MVYTVTLNPALDYQVSVPDFKEGCVNRTERESTVAGGKGINVSYVLKNLGIESTVLGFAGGYTGEEIERQVSKNISKTDFIYVKNGISRINVKIKADNETELNGRGPVILAEELVLLDKKLEMAKSGDIVVFAGSIPLSVPVDFYGAAGKRLNDRGVLVVADTTGTVLKEALKAKPFLVKPNKAELAELYSVEINSDEDVVKYAFELKRAGAVNVLVSMDKAGAILVNEYGEVLKCSAPKGEVVNSVGAGDSMVAGFICGFIEKKDYMHALRLSVACGSGSAFKQGFVTREEALKLMEKI